MPSFTNQVSNIVHTGPTVDIEIVITDALEESLNKQGAETPDPIPATALVDTGATATVIQTGIAARLGINPVGQVEIHTPSSADVECYIYPVRLVLPNNVIVEGITAVEAPLEGQNIQCLIGRDVLSLGVLIYNGYMNQFTLSF